MPRAPMTISLTIDQCQSVFAIDLSRLQSRLETAIAAEQPQSAELTIQLVDDPEIHRLNKTFLQHDWPTDVITFFEDSSDSPLPHTLPLGKDRPIAGELVVSVETALREAQAVGWSVEDELLLYCVHGWLHLCGYDDLTDEARPIMRQREREVLALFGLTPTHLEE